MSKSKDVYLYRLKKFFIILLTLQICSAFSSQDDYINEVQSSCYKKQDTYSCFKYSALKYVSGVASGRAWPFNTRSNSGNGTARFLDDDERAFRLIHIDEEDTNEIEDTEGLFEGSRQFPGDSEFMKLKKFGKRSMEAFLKGHGVSVGLPQGARMISDDDNVIEKDMIRSAGAGASSRGKKKKLAILLPLLSLLGLFKIKFLLVPTLLTVLFIKKMLVLAALFLPTLLATLKVCKVPHPHHTQVEASADPSAYGSVYPNYASASQGYNKDWAASRAYNAYRSNFAANEVKKPMVGPSGSGAVYYNAPVNQNDGL